MVEQPRLQLLVQHVVGRRLERQRGQMRRGDAALQPVEPEAGDRRRIDQKLAQHHEGDGQRQQAGGQPVKPGRQLARQAGHPKRARKRTRRRVRGEKSCVV